MSVCPSCRVEITLTTSNLFTRHRPGVDMLPDGWFGVHCPGSWTRPPETLTLPAPEPEPEPEPEPVAPAPVAWPQRVDTPLAVGGKVHGYAGGVYGGTYECRTIEAVGPDWIVTRTEAGAAEFAWGPDLPHLARFTGPPLDDCVCTYEEPQ